MDTSACFGILFARRNRLVFLQERLHFCQRIYKRRNLEGKWNIIIIITLSCFIIS